MFSRPAATICRRTASALAASSGPRSGSIEMLGIRASCFRFSTNASKWASMYAMAWSMADEPIIEIPIEDTLDLHTFAPRDVKALVTDYLDLAAERGFAEVRIIHGKGTGTLRRIVHGVLERHPRVEGFTLAETWGATVARLRV